MKKIISCITALGLTACSLSAISSNAYYWGKYDASSEEAAAEFYNITENLIQVDDDGMIIPIGGEAEECYIYPDSNLFLIKQSADKKMSIEISSKDDAKVVNSIIEKYNADNETAIKCFESNNSCEIVFYDYASADRAAKDLSSLIKKEGIAEQIVYFPNLKSWSTGYFNADSILTYDTVRSNIDELNTVENYFIENEIDYRYNSGKMIIGGENLSKIEQMAIAVDIYNKTGTRVFHLYLMETNPYFNDGSIDMLNSVDGDANADETLDIADAVMIMQSISNPDEYQLTAQGRYNADIAGDNDGITVEDALAIQKKLTGLE